jgi:Skp family chaperone for outer membrane proteins
VHQTNKTEAASKPCQNPKLNYYNLRSSIKEIMKSIRFIAVMMFFAAMFVTTTLAQTAAPAQGGMKVAVISTAAFGDEKTGITKFVKAYSDLRAEFKPRTDKLQTMQNRLATLAKDIENLSKTPNSVVSQGEIDKKREEGERLQREYTFEAEELKAALQRREQAVVGPIFNDIGKALQDYAKQKGYNMIFDISKDENQMLLFFDLATAEATTLDFIKFYNSRPATTATAAPR